MSLFYSKYDPGLCSMAATFLFRLTLSQSHIPLVIWKSDKVADGFSVYAQEEKNSKGKLVN